MGIYYVISLPTGQILDAPLYSAAKVTLFSVQFSNITQIDLMCYLFFYLWYNFYGHIQYWWFASVSF